MLNESISSDSKIILLKKMLLEKQQELEKRRHLASTKKSKYSRWYSFLIVLLLIAFMSQLFWYQKSGLFTAKKKDSKNNKFSELAMLYQDRQKKDSLKLKILNDKIAFYQEQKEIDSILRDQERLDALLFEDNQLVVNISFPPKKETQKSSIPQNKNNNKVITYTDYLDKKVEQKKVETPKKATNISGKKFYFTADKFAVYPSCKNKRTESKKRKCFNTKVKKYVNKKINKSIFKNQGIKRIDVLIGITEKGIAKALSIKGIQNEIQQQEIFRVIAALPKFIPAVDNRSEVPVKFNLPIVF